VFVHATHVTDRPLDLQLIVKLDGTANLRPDERGITIVLAKSDSGQTMALVLNSN
jgi:hypothetical protein